PKGIEKIRGRVTLSHLGQPRERSNPLFFQQRMCFIEISNRLSSCYQLISIAQSMRVNLTVSLWKLTPTCATIIFVIIYFRPALPLPRIGMPVDARLYRLPSNKESICLKIVAR